jgi:hypothetical protein
LGEQWERWQGAFQTEAPPAPSVAPSPRAGIVSRVRGRRRRQPPAPWRGIPKEHQRAVRRAIRKGELVRDPDQARSVLRFTGRMRRSERPRRRAAAVVFRLALAVWLAAQAVLALRGQWGRGIPVAVVIPLFWICIELWGLVQMRRAPARLAHADAIHRRYLEGLGKPLPDVEAEEAAAPPAARERRARWIVWLFLGTAAAGVLLLWAVQR